MKGSVCAYLVLKDCSFVLFILIAGTVLQNQMRLQVKACSPYFAARRPAGL